MDSPPHLSQALQGIPRPVVALASDYPAHAVISPHHHPRAQLVYAERGVMTVRTGQGSWVVPPERAVWVPALTDHAVHAKTAIAMRSLYIEPAAAPSLPKTCAVVGVSPLLRELILRTAGLPRLYDPDGPDGRLVALLLDEIRMLPTLPLHLPMPNDPRLVKIARAILDAPASGETLEDWGNRAGASSRTLARLFVKETGMTFGRWRQQMRLLAALERLATGQSVTTVAMDLGYESPSAFSSMFKRALGKSPSAYFTAS
ncbi:MAG: helix-turn-helix transcriptional regulator [Rhodospirillales bacterium]